VAASLLSAINYFKKEVNTPLTPITAVSDDKSSNKAALQQYANTYTSTESQVRLRTAEQHLDLYRVLLDDIESSEIRKVENDLVIAPLEMSRTNFDSLKTKLAYLRREMALISPNSLISHGNSMTILRPQFWELLNSRYAMSFSHARIAGQPTRLGATPVSDQLDSEFSVPGATSVVIGSANDSPNGWVFRTHIESGNTNGHTAFPPKEECYSWASNWNVRARIASGGPLTALFGGDSGILHIHTGLNGSPLSSHYSFPIIWGGNVSQTVADISFEIPFTSTQQGVTEIYLSTNQSAAYNLELTLSHAGVVGTPRSDTCVRAHIDYLTPTSNMRQFIESNTRWLNTFGRVIRDPWADPNFSLEALWNERTATSTIMLGEVIDAYKHYVTSYFGTNAGAPSVDDKYIKHGLTGISDMVRITSYPYTSGPFVGLDGTKIVSLLRMFKDDIDFIERLLYEDAAAADIMVNHNLFTNYKCAL
jgi:hypothetical protein